jgi:hypothetical protein
MATPMRRNIAHLTQAERQAFVNAVRQIDLLAYADSVSYWDKEDQIHQGTHNHNGPSFIPWHRELCNRFEKLLQQVDPDVALHYWDWTQDPRNAADGNGGTVNLCTDTLMGTANGLVAGTLAPLHNNDVSAGSRDVTGNPADPPQAIRRNCAAGAPGVASDTTIIHGADALPQADQWPAFRVTLESSHDTSHVFFGPGSTIRNPHTAFEDPFVFLLHANVDRLFAQWQTQPGQDWRLDPNLVYGSESNTADSRGILHNLQPWDGTVEFGAAIVPWTGGSSEIEVKNCRHPSVVAPACYDTLPTTITKVAPSAANPMRFLDVPTGSTTARALRLEVRGCKQVHVTGVLTGDPAFSLHQAAVQSPQPDSYSTETVFMWVKYTAGAPGSSATSQLTATCTETGDVFQVNIVANSITKPTVAVSTVLDSSGSMSSPSGVPGLDRMAVLHQAAPTFLALLEDDDGVGVVRFDTDATPVSPVTAAGSIGSGGGRDNAIAAVNAHATNLAGLTAIGDGIEAAHNQLVGVTGFNQSAILVFTDGEETESKYISEVTSLINERVYAVGLGTPDQLSPTGLSGITNGTGGYLTLTGQLGTDGVMRLAKYFSQLLAGVTNAQIVTDPSGFVLPGQTDKVPFALTEADRRTDVIVLTEAPFAITLTLTAPDGTVVSAAPDATALDAPAMRCLRVPLPVLSAPQAHGGVWTANIDVDRRTLRRYQGQLEQRGDLLGLQRLQAHGLAYMLNVHAESDLQMVVTTTQTGHVPGSVVEVLAVLTETGIPLERQASATVDVTMPDGTSHTVVLQEDEPGVYRTTLPLPQFGHYLLLVKANGRAFNGKPFTREELRSAATWVDPTIRPPRGIDGAQWCEFLLCILEDNRAGRALQERGVNVEGVRDCVKRFCAR